MIEYDPKHNYTHTMGFDKVSFHKITSQGIDQLGAIVQKICLKY